MAEGEEGLQLLSSVAASVPELEKRENDQIKESDGNPGLCRVCGGGGSAFSYGAYCCKACKVFFERSTMLPNIRYSPCPNEQQCSITWFRPDKCQDCRLKKCFAIGMRNDDDRISYLTSQEDRRMEKTFVEELNDDDRLVDIIEQAHQDYCDYTKEKVAVLLEKARSQPEYTQRSPQLACLLNASHGIIESGASYYVEDFMERFESEIKGVVEFARRIPFLRFLSKEDQRILLKGAVFEVLLVRLACMFDCETDSFICRNGLVLSKESLQSTSKSKSLLSDVFCFAHKMNILNLSDSEVGLFCALVVFNPDHVGLGSRYIVLKVRRKIKRILKVLVTDSHPENQHIFRDLMMNIPFLIRTKNFHFEKLLAYQVEARNVAG